MNSQKILQVLFICIGFTTDLSALQITNLYVPKDATHEANLDCKYELDYGDILYHVKWYKDENEFYRCYVNGSVQEFWNSDVRIYHSNFAAVGSCPVTLTGLTSKSSGAYTCEVSLDSPKFSVVAEMKYMKFIKVSPLVQREMYNDIVEVDEKNSCVGKQLNNVVIFIFIVNIFIK